MLERPALVAEWRDDLDGKRERIRMVRERLAQVAVDRGLQLGFVRSQHGLFSTLPVTPEQVARLAVDHAVHMPATGRVNVAGLSEETVPRFVDALCAIGVSG